MKDYLLALFCVCAPFASASDLKLSDGRVLKNFRVMSQTATTLTVRYDHGAIKLAKTLLPPELQKEYPVDAEAAEAEAAANAKGKAAYEAQMREAREKRAESHAARVEKNASQKASLAELEQAKAEAKREAEIEVARESGRREVEAVVTLPQRIHAAVERRAERYFVSERKPAGNNSTLKIECQIDLEEPREVPGWPGRYEVVGFGWQEYFNSRGSSFAGDKGWFRATVQLDKNNTPKVVAFEPLASEPLRTVQAP